MTKRKLQGLFLTLTPTPILPGSLLAAHGGRIGQSPPLSGGDNTIRIKCAAKV